MAATCPTGYGMAGRVLSAGLVVVTGATDKAATSLAKGDPCDHISGELAFPQGCYNAWTAVT